MKQMTIEKIICDLKEVKDIEQLQVLICKLEESLNEKNYIKHNNSKRLNGIKRVLNNGKNRPVLNCYTPYKNGYSAITDSYQMYLLKEVKLPFKCAFNSTFNEEKDCWTYTKNKPQEIQNEQREVIEQFQQGGKPSKKKDWNSYYEFLETLPKNLQKGNDTDTLEGYRMKLLFDNTPNLWTFEDGLKGENPIFTKEEDGFLKIVIFNICRMASAFC